MTTSRIVRGTKGRIFLYVILVIFLTGIIACYNSTLSHLDEAKKTNEVCHQENENLNTQLQMISDYKQRLEVSMKSEKVEHQQKINELNAKSNEEKAKQEKILGDLKLQLSTLQKHYNLLEAQHDDYRKECAENQQEQQNEVNNLRTRVKELEENVKKLAVDRENLKDVKEKLEAQLKGTRSLTGQSENEVNHLNKENSQLKRELEDVKGKLSARNFETLEAPKADPASNFSKQLQLPDGAYQIGDEKNVGEEPPANNIREVQHADENVLAVPNLNANAAPSKAAPKASSRASLDGALPLRLPSVSPESPRNDVSKEMRHEDVNLRAPVRKVPDGVVLPAPMHAEPEKGGVNNDIIHEAFPIRYRNEIIENERLNEEKAEKSERDMNLRGNARADENERENGAHEVFDEKLKDAHGEVVPVGDSPNDGQEPPDYGKEGANDVQLEQDDPEEDDDPDYMGHVGRRPKEPAVRN